MVEVIILGFYGLGYFTTFIIILLILMEVIL